MMKSAEHKHGMLHIDFGETSAIPEIHVDHADRADQEFTQRRAEKEGKICIIKDGVAVPDVMRED